MKILSVISLLILTQSCCSNNQENDQIGSEKSHLEVEFSKKVIEPCGYSLITIPEFFTELISNHQQDFIAINPQEFKQFCLSNKVDEKVELIALVGHQMIYFCLSRNSPKNKPRKCSLTKYCLLAKHSIRN